MLLVVQKAVILFLGLLFFNTSLFATLPFSEDKLSKLSQNPQWHRLLHFKNGESEIDDKAFFFAQDGKRDPKAELKASIKKLISDKSDDENSTLCRYPSRSTWILKQLPILKKEIFTPHCKKLNRELKELGAKEVTLILVSAHINSPASAFGHTFLRIDNNPNTPLLSYAVNYAAQTREENGFIYAYKGLFGGYRGRYSIEPYYKKLKEYSDLEQRDIWEYKLNLTQEEIDRLVLHIFEIRHFYADYFFLSENCSYNILWLIDIAKKDSSLINSFNFKAIPIDTIRAVISKNLIQNSRYRPSQRKKILALSRAIKKNRVALEFAKSKEYNLSKIEKLNKKEKIASLELATALLKIRRSDNEIDKKEYLKDFLKLLKARSKLGKIKREKIPQPPSPENAHLSAKSSISYGSDNSIKAKAKVSYHDIYDSDYGHIAGGYISFFDTTVEYKDKRLKLDEIDFLKIKSYALQDAIFKPISWEVSVGGKRIFNNELNGYLKAGGGITLGDNKLYGYTTITPTIYYKDEEQESIAINAGLLYNPSKYLKIGILTSDEWFKKDKSIKEIEPFITYSFEKKSALNLKYKYRDIDGAEEKEATISWFWYY